MALGRRHTVVRFEFWSGDCTLKGDSREGNLGGGCYEIAAKWARRNSLGPNPLGPSRLRRFSLSFEHALRCLSSVAVALLNLFGEIP